MLKNEGDTFSFLSWWHELQRYKPKYLRADLKAGITVALLALPQAMTYALIVDLPASVGIFSVVFSTIFVSLLGFSRHLISGPTNAIAILMQTAVAEVMRNYYHGVDDMIRDAIAIQTTIHLTLMIGIIQLLISVFKLGKLTHFVSRPVINGYILGVALAVLVTQSFAFIGIHRPMGSYALYELAWKCIINVDFISWMTFAVGVVSLILLLILPKIKKGFPHALVMLVVVSVGLYCSKNFWGVGLEVPLVRIKDVMDGLWPQWQVPHFSLHVLNKLFPSALAIALMGVLEVSSVGRAMSANSGQRLNVNQDLFGLGVGNIVNAFFISMPGSGSPSRSYLNFISGGKTRFSGVFAGIFVALIAGLFGFLLVDIPVVALSALLFVTAVRMINVEQVKYCLFATRADAIVLVVTVLVCLLFSIDVAFYIGALISIGFYLHRSARPRLIECSYSVEVGLQAVDKSPDDVVRIISVEGELFFGSVDIFQETLRSITDDSVVRVIILNLHNARHFDATACLALKQLHDYLEKSGRYLLLANVSESTRKAMKRSGLYKDVGRNQIFTVDMQDFNCAIRRALEYADTLISTTI